jgi:uncharacterized membrane-anchored protein
MIPDSQVSLTRPTARQLLNKVPQVTIYFWVIKVLCTTVGETAADFLNVNLNLGLTVTSVVMTVLLVVALVIQFRRDCYVPWVYWLAVALISVVGTLVTDNLSDNLGVPLEVTTVVFTVVLAVVFAWWYSTERTLSIHSIVTTRREGFYWLTILFTFALGTAAGDLMAEVLGLGYLVTGIIVASMITVTAIAWRLGLNAVLAFWIIYILTRPLGASIGDGLTQPAGQGGLGLGATATSVIFVAGILGAVTYLTITKADVIANVPVIADGSDGRGGLRQTLTVVTLVLLVAGTGYWTRKSALSADISPLTPAAAVALQSPLGDLSAFRVITADTLSLVDAGNQAEATTRVTDLETAWDNAEARLKPRDTTAWHDLDDKIDTVLRALRSTQPDQSSERTALTTLLAALASPTASASPTALAPPTLPAAAAPVARKSALGDLSAFRVITADTLKLVNTGNQRGASARVTDLETAWDNAEARLRPKDPTAWHDLDGKIDTVLRAVRSAQPNPAGERTALTTLLAAITPPTVVAAPVVQRSALGDLSAFRVITADTLKLVNTGNQRGASARVTDLETAWDNAEARLKPKDPTAWHDLDGKIDTVLRALRSTQPNLASERTALTMLVSALH